MPFESGLGHDETQSHGLMLCTEYLGFESYDMRMSDNEVENKMTCHAEVETERVEAKRRKTKENVVVQAQKKTVSSASLVIKQPWTAIFLSPSGEKRR